MTKNWLITEKVIAIFEIALGSVILYFSYLSVNNLINIFSQSSGKDDISFFSLVMHFHFGFLIGLIGIISGTLLLLAKRSGWVVSLINSTILITELLITTFFDKFSQPGTGYKVTSVLICVFISIFCLLLFKPFKEKYGAARVALLLAILANIIFIVDNFFNNVRF
jgi:hypothetical protein